MRDQAYRNRPTDTPPTIVVNASVNGPHAATVAAAKETGRFVYIGRRNWHYPASDWANPYRIGRDGDRRAVLALYAAWIHGRPDDR